MPIYPDPINLNTLHERAGGTSETTCSLNDTDIKDLAHGSATGLSLSHHRSNLTEGWVVGNVAGGSAGGFYGYSEGDTDLDDLSMSAILNRIHTGWDWTVMLWVNSNPGYFILKAEVDSNDANPDSASNTGWEVVKVGSTYFYRADATYSNPGGTDAMQWIWNTSNSSYDGANPYPTNGDDTIIRFG